jgi:hypothetical protein
VASDHSEFPRTRCRVDDAYLGLNPLLASRFFKTVSEPIPSPAVLPAGGQLEFPNGGQIIPQQAWTRSSLQYETPTRRSKIAGTKFLAYLAQKHLGLLA